METTRWLARVRHDLVKRLVWPARDRRDLGGAPAPGELCANLIDEEGRPASAATLWGGLRAEGPEAPGAARFLAGFGDALDRAVAAAAAGDVDGVLALEAAFDDLARALNGWRNGE